MGLTEIITAISEVGFMVVAASVLIYFYIRNEKDRRKTAQDQEKARLKAAEDQEKARAKEWEAQSKLVNSLLTNQNKQIEDQLERFEKQNEQLMEILRSTDKKEHTFEEDEFQEKVNNEITQLLKKLRESTNSCRAIFVKYHNGLYDLVGNSAAKMSATNEDVAIGIQPFQPFFQNQFRGFLSWWCSKIRDEGVCYITEIDTLKKINENSMYEFLKGRGVTSAYGRAITDTNKNVIGYIMVEYMNNHCPTPNSVENCLMDKAIKISALVGLTKGGTT